MTEKKEFAFIYLHGFKSSPESNKATFIRKYCQDKKIEFLCPPLDIDPKVAISQVSTVIDNVTNVVMETIIIGSSLGGFYTAWAMQNHPGAEKCKAIILNPTTNPSKDLESEVEQIKSWQEKTLGKKYFKNTHLDYLKQLEKSVNPPIINSKKIFLVAAKGDEILDWNDMVSFFKDCEQYVIEGSDHGLSNFSLHWPMISKFIYSGKDI